MNDIKPTTITVDGACQQGRFVNQRNPEQGRGGWAWMDDCGQKASGYDLKTTNQRMEIKAAIEALRACDDSCVKVESDSQYLVNCAEGKWRKKKERRFVEVVGFRDKQKKNRWFFLD